MGLDMYLESVPKVSRKTLKKLRELDNKIDNEDFKKTKEYEKIKNYIVKRGEDNIYSWDSLFTEECYWRKANAIHNWFVENIQDGEDDCSTHEVSMDDIINLRDICKEVLDNSELVEGDIIQSYTLDKDENGEIIKTPNYEKGKVIKDSSTAEDLLPTTSGFFFGGTEYDEWYYNDIKKTYDLCEKLLREFDFENRHLCYSGSW